MGKHKLSINNPKNRFRRRIIEYASTVEKFNIHQLIDWYYDNYPRDVPNRNKLNGYLPIIDNLEKIGYTTYNGRRNMEYKLRSD